jgi:hypothetical protein
MKFKVGDRVMGNEKANKYGITIKGWTGTVTQVYKSHFCAREDGDTTNFPLDYDCFDLVNTNQTITIYRKDRDVIATIKEGKKVVKSGKATCNPADKFNFEYGAKLAFARLMGMEVKTEAAAFDWSAFKSGKFAVHCDTEEKARAFLKECDEQGIRWQGGDKASSKTHYASCGENTCYSNYMMGKDRIGYSRKGYFIDESIKVIDYTPSIPFVREVRRPAEVGEWIKITSSDGRDRAHGCSVGDIYCVKAIGFLNIPIAITSKGRNSIQCEYVVLENYKPKPKPFKKAKVGDKIKIVQEGRYYHCPSVKIGDVQTVITVDETESDSVCTNNGNVFFDINEEYIILEEAPEIKRVKRKAEVGEYVEIVNAFHGAFSNHYKNGDIMKIIKINRGYRHFGNGIDEHLYESEYVVLENYREGK